MDSAVCKAHALTTLIFHNNKLEKLPDEIHFLSNLTELRVDGNRISALTSQISALTALRLLQLSGCPPP